MNTADRRAEIINILLVRRRITAKELADEFHVTMNTLTPLELKVLQEMYELAEGIHKKVLFQIICKYGPDKLEL